MSVSVDGIEDKARSEMGRFYVERLTRLAEDRPAVKLASRIYDVHAPGVLIDYVSYGWMDSAVRGVNVVVRVDRFSSVSPMVEFLEREGVKFGKTEDYVELDRRSYHGKMGRARINILAFPAEGSSCRRVETGEMEPVYRLECDGEG